MLRMWLRRVICMTHLKAWQQLQHLFLRQLPELGPLERDAAFGQYAALLGDVTCCVDVVTRDHTNQDTCSVACGDCLRNFLTHRVLQELHTLTQINKR